MARKKNPEKRTRIFKATLQLIETNGMAGVKMAEVASLSRMAVGTVYLYFADKHALFQALRAYIDQNLRSHLDPLMASDQFIQQFQQVWRGFLQYCIDFPDHMVFLDQWDRSPYHQLPGATPSYAFVVFHQILENGKIEGWVGSIKTALMVNLVVGASKEIVNQYMLDLIDLNTDDFHDIYQLVWRAIRK